ncbi:MAG: uncharacterized protein QOE92_975 [Chloroflexota bacterium]|jgi:uncharacterized protein (DUF779 family)|nr:uncharacterized protein [Chloroflexota bacterium]
MADTVTLTDRARALFDQVKAGRGPLTMVLGSGCCDGGSPFLFENYPPPANHRNIGSVEGIPVWLDNGLWQDIELDLTIDAVRDPASDSFSAEAELGYRLVLV